MRVLFLCTGNSCRSQMAEGWARALRPDLEVASAGIVAHGLNPNAVQVMAEAGVDISGHHSRTLAELEFEPELVVTVCGDADERCPVLPGTTRKLHHGFDDPPRLAQGLSEDEALPIYRRVRDEIRAFVQALS